MISITVSVIGEIMAAIDSSASVLELLLNKPEYIYKEKEMVLIQEGKGHSKITPFQESLSSVSPYLVIRGFPSRSTNT